MTLKEMLNTALLEIGFREYTEYFNSTKKEPRQVAALANRELHYLSQRAWQALRKKHTISMTSATSYPLPADYRQFVPDTAWSDTRRANFPTDPEEWFYYDARGIDTGLQYRVRIFEGQIQVQNPDSGTDLIIEYVSNYPVEDAGSTAKQRFTADDDTLLLDDDLLMMGVIWRFKKVKGLDFTVEFQSYRDRLNSTWGTDQNAQTVRTAEPYEEDLYLPQANFWVS